MKETALNKTIRSCTFTLATTSADLYIQMGHIIKKGVHKNDTLHKWKNMYKYTYAGCSDDDLFAIMSHGYTLDSFLLWMQHLKLFLPVFSFILFLFLM